MRTCPVTQLYNGLLFHLLLFSDIQSEWLYVVACSPILQRRRAQWMRNCSGTKMYNILLIRPLVLMTNNHNSPRVVGYDEVRTLDIVIRFY